MAGSSWQYLFPEKLPPAGDSWEEIFPRLDEADLAPKLWAQLAKAVDPRYERPRARPGVQIERLAGDKGAIVWYDEGGKEGAYVQLAPQDLFLFERMDGKRSQVDLVVDYCLKYKSLAATRVAALVEELRAQKLLAEPADELYPKLVQYFQNRTFAGIVNKLVQTFLQREFAVSGIDYLLTRLYRSGVWLLYTRPVQILCWVVAFSGLVTYLLLLGSARFAAIGEHGEGAISLLLCQIVALFQHELGHAFTVKAFGRRVRRAGLLLIYGLPGAFVDTTDIWPAGRKAQLWVTWAGPFTNLVNGGLAALLVALNLNSPFAPLLFQFALGHYLLATLNLTPFLRLDGYYLLADWLQIANLRPRSFGFMKNGLPHLLREAWKEGRIWPRLRREQWILTIFGTVSSLWIINLLALGVITAPIRVMDATGQLLGGVLGSNPVGAFFLLLGLLFTSLLLIRGFGTLRNWGRKLAQISLGEASWRTALVFGLLALFVAALPTLLSLQNLRASRIYLHGLALVTDGLLVFFASRLVRELRGAPLRQGLLGMVVTGASLLVIDAYVTLAALWPETLPELPHWIWLVGIVPGMLMCVPAAPAMYNMRWAAIGWTLVLGQIATYSLLLASFVGEPLFDLLVLSGHTFYLAGLTMHWQLAHRPMNPARSSKFNYGNDSTSLLRAAVARVVAEIARNYRELAGKEAFLKLAKEFNRTAAYANLPLWLNMYGEMGDQTEGLLEQRTAAYRAALEQLCARISATHNHAFASDLQLQAVLELPRPHRAIFQQALETTSVPEITPSLPVLSGSSPTSNSQPPPPIIDDDRMRLRMAGRRVAETLVIGCQRCYGKMLTERALAGFNRTAALANWPLYIRSNGRIRDELGSPDLLSVSRIYSEALQDLLGRLAQITGVAFIERGLTQVYDNLPWDAREVATTLLFEKLSWAHHLTRTAQADNRLAFLSTVPLLGWMAPAELSEVAQNLTVRRVRGGRKFISQDTYLNQALLVRQGSVQALQNKDGIWLAVEQIGPTGIIGLRSVLEGQASPYRYIAQTSCELWQIPAKVVQQQLGPLLQAQDTLDEELEKLSLLGQIPLFAGLETGQRRAVARALEVQQFEPGDEVLRVGQESRGLFIVRGGELDVLVPVPGGDDYRVSMLGPGEFFGESALLNQSRVTATVRARSRVELLCLPPAAFYALLADSLAAPLTQVHSRRAEERARMAQLLTLAKSH